MQITKNKDKTNKQKNRRRWKSRSCLGRTTTKSL